MSNKSVHENSHIFSYYVSSRTLDTMKKSSKWQKSGENHIPSGRIGAQFIPAEGIFVLIFGLAQVDPQLEGPYGFEA